MNFMQQFLRRVRRSLAKVMRQGTPPSDRSGCALASRAARGGRPEANEYLPLELNLPASFGI